jgi:RNA polymerase sigma factor for flagellar operon FliA
MDEYALSQKMPTYFVNSPQGALFETLRLLVETHDDIEEVARRRRESTHTVLMRLRSNGVKILTPEELAKNHYEKAKKACEDANYNKQQAADNLKISVYTVANWLRGGPKLPFPRRVKNVKERQTRLRAKKLKKLRSSYPTERGLSKLSFLPGIKAENSSNLEDLMCEYSKLLGTGKENEYLENFYPFLKFFCTRRASRTNCEAADILCFAFMAMKEMLAKFKPGCSKKPRSWLYQMMLYRITDYMRDEDTKGRVIKRYISTLMRLEEKHNGYMTDESILEQTGWTADILRQVRESQIISIDSKIYNSNDKPVSRSSIICDRHDPWQEIKKNEDIEHILHKAFPEERKFLSAHYLDGLTLSDIGKKYALSESRVSQIIAKSIARIKLIVKQEQY